MTNYKNLQEALNYAVMIIKAYKMECECLTEYLDSGRDPEAFCQGEIFNDALTFIDRLRRKDNNE